MVLFRGSGPSGELVGNSPRDSGPGGQWLGFIFIWWRIVLEPLLHDMSRLILLSDYLIS